MKNPEEQSVKAIHFGIDVGSWEVGGNIGYYIQEPFVQIDLPEEDRFYSVMGWEERPEIKGRPSWMLLEYYDADQPPKIEVLKEDIGVNFDPIGDVTAVVMKKFNENIMPNLGIFGPMMLPDADVTVGHYINLQQLNGGRAGGRKDRSAIIRNQYK